MNAPETGQLARLPDPKAHVIAWLLDGHRDEDIKEALATKFPEVNAVAVLAEVVQHFQEAATCDKTVLLGWALEAYRDLYRRMIAIGDFAGAMKAVKELAGLAGRTRGVRSDPKSADPAATRTPRPERRRRRVDRKQPGRRG